MWGFLHNLFMLFYPVSRDIPHREILPLLDHLFLRLQTLLDHIADVQEFIDQIGIKLGTAVRCDVGHRLLV